MICERQEEVREAEVEVFNDATATSPLSCREELLFLGRLEEQKKSDVRLFRPTFELQERSQA